MKEPVTSRSDWPPPGQNQMLTSSTAKSILAMLPGSVRTSVRGRSSTANPGSAYFAPNTRAVSLGLAKRACANGDYIRRNQSILNLSHEVRTWKRYDSVTRLDFRAHTGAEKSRYSAIQIKAECPYWPATKWRRSNASEGRSGDRYILPV